ncbi:2'-5' RNA ligase family protein [Pseudochryseolinea flava]|uniref:2'-5' RNA ligase family protein n=1 Tax=Pseudochryseolinea flava TaxID=2059302 RepID=A0A364XTD1_9BACT|nr:2'-5' RNA ligase family protein [Pseudochryseolinea flava]
MPLGQNSTRRQLTLFVSDDSGAIEKIRQQFNPIQHKLISAHVTLCREDEIVQIDRVIKNTELIKSAGPLKITFNKVERFEGGKGVWLPSSTENKQFHELRREILKGLNDTPRHHQPHLTLMHPRNSSCTDKIFDQIRAFELPTEILFEKISLVEQHDGGPWMTINEYRIAPIES